MTSQAIPYLCVNDAAAAIEFYKSAFGATEVMRLTEPGGRIGHAEIKVGEALIMLSEEYPELDIRSPQSIGGTPVCVHLYIDDVDTLAANAVAAGATILKPVEDQFYGDRTGRLKDPFGHVWIVATVLEELSLEEMQRRYEELLKQ